MNKYIVSLKKYFSREEGGDEIVNDIENRIAELFGNRLRLGINCITDEDVESIINNIGRPEDFDTEYEESALSISEVEKDMIAKALERHNGKRKMAAKELGISERTLYRKIKEYDL